jgi:Mn2+/Fe2+ NRAMP family transporter
MGDYTNGRVANILGFITLLIMTAAAVILLVLQF